MKAKITGVTFQKEYDGKHGKLYLHKITYDGNVAYYSSKKKEQSKFIKGNEAEFTEEVRQGKNGDYSIIKPIYAQMGGGSNYSKSVKSEQSRYSGFAMSYAKDLCVAGKISITELEIYTRQMVDLMVKIDKELGK